MTRTPAVDPPPVPGSPPRLFCFHHAGGDGSAFRDWQRRLGPSVAVHPVRLPGRERRLRCPYPPDLGTLVADPDAELTPWLAEPHAFYGHSMGALVAFALTRHRHARGAPLPRALLVGAFGDPSDPSPLEHVPALGDDELVDLLVDLGGMSEVVRRYPAWTAPALALLRADLALCRGHRVGEAVALPVPVHAFTGAADPLLLPARVRGWSAHTASGFTLEVVPGGHFFLEHPAALERVLTAAANALLATRLVTAG